MARIVIGWELGSSPDLLYDVRDVGRALASEGHRITYIVGDTVALAGLFPADEQPEILPAPLPSARPESVAKAAREGGFVDKLAVQGFAAVDSLQTLTAVWLRLLARENPQLALAIGAPVLALATRGLRPLFALGSAESMPPPDMSRFPRITANVAPALTDQKLLLNANTVAQAVGGRAVAQPTDLLAGDASLVYGLPHLDPYLPLRSVRSTPLRTLPRLITPAGSPSLVAVLDVNHPFIDTIAIALTDLAKAAVHVHIRGITRPMRTFLAQTSGVVLHDRLEDAMAHIDEATYVLHHCTPMVAEAALASGRPHVILPYVHEQGVAASFLERHGCARVLTSAMAAPDLADYLVRQFRDLNLTQQAQLLARDLAAVKFPDTMTLICSVAGKLAGDSSA